MLKRKLKISAKIVLLATLTSLTACSTVSQVGQSARKMASFGGGSNAEIDNKLIIPPTLKIPAGSTASAATTASSTNASKPTRTKASSLPNGNYYIIVGTYPDQLDALDTFTRISSIGLKGSTMETRRTKAGALLHMVRLGPYQNQEDIDKAKDSLTNTGLSQFKIVKN